MPMTIIAGGEPEGSLRGATIALRELVLGAEQFRNVHAGELHLAPSDVTALGHLYRVGPLSPKDLAAMLGITSGTMTAMLDRVEKAGFLTRSNNPQDRRSLVITITPAGQHALAWLYEKFDEAIRRALEAVPGVGPDELKGALEAVSRSLGEDVRATEQSGRTASNRPRAI